MKKTFVISLIFIVCGILGFVCQLLYAYFFGSGKEMDIYFSLLSIPAIITGASGAVFSSLFFPIFARIDSVELDSYIWTIKECVSKIALLIAVVGFVITYFNMDYIVGPIEKTYYNLSLLLAFLLWINAYMSIVNGFLSSVQNYFKNFLIVSLSQLLVYIFIILFVLILHQVIGVNSIAFGMLFSAFISYIVNRYYGNLFKKSQSYTKMDSFVVVQNIILIIISFFPFLVKFIIAISTPFTRYIGRTEDNPITASLSNSPLKKRTLIIGQANTDAKTATNVEKTTTASICFQKLINPWLTISLFFEERDLARSGKETVDNPILAATERKPQKL